jgi:cytochrome c553
MARSRFLLGLLIPLTVGATAQPLAAEAQPAKAPDTLEQRVLACAQCHGKQGEGIKKNEYYPRLAGKPAGYLYNQLVNFRERRREWPIMTYLVGYLSDEYLREIAEYYSKLRPPYPPPDRGASEDVLARGETLVMKGDPSRNLPACAACHGKALTGVEPAIPGIVGLHAHYVSAQLGAWRNKLRRAQEPDCMAQIAALLAPLDVLAVSAWLAAQPASADKPPAPAKSVELPLECGVTAK